jgi:hypothetical protein
MLQTHGSKTTRARMHGRLATPYCTLQLHPALHHVPHPALNRYRTLYCPGPCRWAFGGGRVTSRGHPPCSGSTCRCTPQTGLPGRRPQTYISSCRLVGGMAGTEARGSSLGGCPGGCAFACSHGVGIAHGARRLLLAALACCVGCACILLCMCACFCLCPAALIVHHHTSYQCHPADLHA